MTGDKLEQINQGYVVVTGMTTATGTSAAQFFPPGGTKKLVQSLLQPGDIVEYRFQPGLFIPVEGPILIVYRSNDLLPQLLTLVRHV